MSRLFVMLIVVLFIPSFSVSETIIWDTDYELHQGFTVGENTILIIEPGVTIYFDDVLNAAANITVDSGGIIEAVGLPGEENNVIFDNIFVRIQNTANENCMIGYCTFNNFSGLILNRDVIGTANNNYNITNLIFNYNANSSMNMIDISFYNGINFNNNMVFNNCIFNDISPEHANPVSAIAVQDIGLEREIILSNSQITNVRTGVLNYRSRVKVSNTIFNDTDDIEEGAAIYTFGSNSFTNIQRCYINDYYYGILSEIPTNYTDIAYSHIENTNIPIKYEHNCNINLSSIGQNRIDALETLPYGGYCVEGNYVHHVDIEGGANSFNKNYNANHANRNVLFHFIINGEDYLPHRYWHNEEYYYGNCNYWGEYPVSRPFNTEVEYVDIYNPEIHLMETGIMWIDMSQPGSTFDIGEIMQYYTGNTNIFQCEEEILTQRMPPLNGWLSNPGTYLQQPACNNVIDPLNILIRQIRNYFAACEYDSTIIYCDSLIQNSLLYYDVTEAIDKMLYSQMSLGLGSYDLESYMQTLADTSSINEIRHRACMAVAQVKTLKEEYNDAIYIIEQEINNEDNYYYDSLITVAVGNKIYVELAKKQSVSWPDEYLENHLAATSVIGNLASLKPVSTIDAMNNIDELYEKGPGREPLSYNINNNTLWDYPQIVLKNDVIVQSGKKLTIGGGTRLRGDNIKIHVYGELGIDGNAFEPVQLLNLTENNTGIEILYEQGSSDSSKISYAIFSNSNVAVTLKTTIGIINRVSFVNCNYGIFSANSYGIEVKIDSCIYIDERDYQQKSIHMVNVKEESYIKNSEYYGKMYPIYIMDGSLTIENNYIEGFDTTDITDDISAIEVKLMNGKIARNSIYNYPTGILLYDSDPMLMRNKIEECYNEALWLINDSYPDMTDAGGGAYNWFQNNGAAHDTSAQIRIAGKIYPYMKGGLNNIWQATGGHAVVSTTPPPGPTKLMNNYWGTDMPDPAVLFNPYTLDIMIDPFEPAAIPSPDGYRTQSVYDDLLDEALAFIEDGEYADAIENLEDVALEDSSVHNRVGAVSLLTDCWIKVENDLSTLITFLEDLADTTASDRIAHEALHCKAQLNVELENYEEAIAFYEWVLDDPATSFEDSICAIIDAGRIYLLENGDYDLLSVPDDKPEAKLPAKDGERSTQATGDRKDLQPESYGQYIHRSHELMSQLRRQSLGGQEEVAMPERFALHQNYPNPFNPVTNLRFDLPRNMHVKLHVYNILGQRVLAVLDGRMDAGFHRVNIDMQHYASGVYFYTIQAGDFKQVKKMVLLK